MWCRQISTFLTPIWWETAASFVYYYYYYLSDRLFVSLRMSGEGFFQCRVARMPGDACCDVPPRLWFVRGFLGTLGCTSPEQSHQSPRYEGNRGIHSLLVFLCDISTCSLHADSSFCQTDCAKTLPADTTCPYLILSTKSKQEKKKRINVFCFVFLPSVKPCDLKADEGCHRTLPHKKVFIFCFAFLKCAANSDTFISSAHYENNVLAFHQN